MKRPEEIKNSNIIAKHLGNYSNNDYYLLRNGDCWKCVKYTTCVRGFYHEEYHKIKVTPRVAELLGILGEEE